MKTSAHHAASIGLVFPVGLLVHSLTSDTSASVATAIGCALGVAISPDLDLGENRKAKPRNFLWVWLWWPYGKAVKHRSFWSHFPIVGTFGRVVYLGAILTGLTLVFKMGWLAALVSWRLIAWVIVGLGVADTAHWVMDHF